MASLKIHSRNNEAALYAAFILLLIAPLNLVSARRPGKGCHGYNTAFSFPNFNSDLQQLSLLGDAQVHDAGLQVSGSKPQTAGGVFFSKPIRLSSPLRKGESLSFSSFFSFSMDANKGEGIAFVISPSKSFSGLSGPWFGLSDGLTPLPHTVAIEFDTSMNAEVQDPSESHIGLDLESLVSLATAEISDGFSLKDDERLYAWIDYRAPVKVLEVRLSRSQGERPEKPILSYNVDLGKIWQEEMFVGFCSSTGEVSQRHVIYSWSFMTQDFGMWRFRPGFFGDKPHGPGDWHHGPRDWHHGPGDWHHGPKDWFRGPHDWHHGPRDGHHGPQHEGFPYWPSHEEHHGWHPDDHQHHHDNDDSSFDDLSDVWEVVTSLLLGAVCGTIAAGASLAVWYLIRKRITSDTEEDAGILYGYQKLSIPSPDVEVDGNGYQKLSTTEPEGKTDNA